jgi:hypothetical protein
MRDFKRWSTPLSIIGGIALLIGSLDPIEGSAMILPGSGLLALGSYLGHGDRRAIAYRTWSFLLVALGVGAMFGLSVIGGVGGSSGHSIWWALLILPYVAGWSIDIWGPGSPRWLSMAGIAIGLWYLAILWMMLQRGPTSAYQQSLVPPMLVAVIGIVTMVACAVRLSTHLR